LSRFVPGRAGFYEVYFVEVQDAEAHTGLWVRYTLRSPTTGPEGGGASLWAMFFDRRDPSKSYGLKRTVPIAAAEIGTDRFRFALDGGEISSSGCRGKIEQDGRKIEWDLSWGEDKNVMPFPFARMYSTPLPKTKWMLPHFDLRASGRYSAWPEETWTLEKAPGIQSHIWGTALPLRTIWAHCNTFEQDRTAVFEGLVAQLKIGPVITPPMTLFVLHYKGVDYYFNRPLDLVRKNESRLEPPAAAPTHFPVGRWIVGGGNDKIRFRGELWGEQGTFLGVKYDDTDDSTAVCNHTKLGHARIEILLKDGSHWRVAETLTSKAVALEFVGREADPRIPVTV
jgi:hypothetical protein